MLKIYGYAESINVRKVLWMCEEVGMPFQREDWGGNYRSTAEPAFSRMNPTGMVPVIDDNGVLVWESNVIVRYLAARCGRSDLLPADFAARAQVEQWMDWQASDFNNGWRIPFQALVRRNPAYQDPVALECAIAVLSKLLAVVEGQLASTKACIAGANFTVADIVIGLSLHRCLSMPAVLGDFPNVQRYLTELGKREGFRRYGRGGGV